MEPDSEVEESRLAGSVRTYETRDPAPDFQAHVVEAEHSPVTPGDTVKSDGGRIGHGAPR
jgi:hypothetical protein